MMLIARTQLIRSLRELDDIKEAWIRLENIENGPSIFQSWIWNRTWVECVLPSRKNASLDVRVLEDGAGRILAILPFFEENILGSFAKLTQFLGHRMSYHNDILLVEPKNSELVKEVVQTLCKDLDPRIILHLRHLDEKSLFTKELIRRGFAEPQCNRLKITADPRVNDQSLRLGRSTRRRYKGQANKLQREYGRKFLVRSSNDLTGSLDELFDLHQRRFTSQKRSTNLTGSNLTFQKNVVIKLRSYGIFEIVELHAVGKIIASTLMAVDKGRYFCIQTGFDPEFSQFSPMRLLLTETMRHGFEDLKCESFDLGAGYESYKYDWKPSVGTNYFCCIGGSGPYGKLLAVLYRFAFRRRLPTIPKGR